MANIKSFSPQISEVRRDSNQAAKSQSVKAFEPPKTVLDRLAQAVVWFGGKFVLHNWFDLQVEGLEHLPANQPVMLAANHSSHLDGPAVIAAVNRKMNQVYSLAAKDYFFDHSLKGQICQRILNMVPFQRGGQSLDSLKLCQELIAQNKIILLFPEGTRSKTGDLQPFKLGTGFLAMQLNVSVIPTYIEGSFQAFPKGARFPRRHPIRVRFGPPIAIADYQARQQDVSSRQLCREIVAEIRSTIEVLAAASLQGISAAEPVTQSPPAPMPR